MKVSLKIMFAVLVLIWLIPGLFGREPWMNDEPYTFGVVDHMVKGGDWVVPVLAGEPFVEKPPLYFWTAALTSNLVHVLHPPDAARLASGFYMLLILIFTGLAAKELLGGQYVETALLILMGCSSVLLTAHKMITDIALLCGFAVALYGFALSRRRFVLGGFWLGTGVGIGFLSKGLLAPGVIGITAIVLPLAFLTWRKKNYLYSLIVAFAAALPWLLVWPIALYRRSPDLFVEWLWFQNFGRFLGFFVEGAHHAGGLTISLARGFRHLSLERLAIPVIPLAVWSLWRHRRQWRDLPAFQIPLTIVIVMLTVLSLSANVRPLYALPIVIPLSLIAAAGIESLPVKAEAAITWGSVALFGLTSVIIWAFWLVSVTGRPAFAALKLNQMGVGSYPSFNVIFFCAALGCSVFGVYSLVHRIRLGSSAMTTWTVGITVVWGLASTLWLPTINAQENYHEVFISMRQAIPPHYHCIASEGLDENGRAMLEYYEGIRTQRVEIKDAPECDLLLLESHGEPRTPRSADSWRLLWEKRKPEQAPKERFMLFQRTGQETLCRLLIKCRLKMFS